MKNKIHLLSIMASLLVVGAPCLATDFDPLSPPASSITGADESIGQFVLAVQQSKDISVDSKNINIVNKNGAVIITGSVASDRDREEIGNIAAKCGCVNVRNKLTVKTTSKNTDVSTTNKN